MKLSSHLFWYIFSFICQKVSSVSHVGRALFPITPCEGGAGPASHIFFFLRFNCGAVKNNTFVYPLRVAELGLFRSTFSFF